MLRIIVEFYYFGRLFGVLVKGYLAIFLQFANFFLPFENEYRYCLNNSCSLRQ